MGITIEQALIFGEWFDRWGIKGPAATLGVAAARAFCEERASGAAEHAIRSAAEITERAATSGRHTGTIVLPRRIVGVPKGHGDAWFRRGRQTDRREPRNAVPPR